MQNITVNVITRLDRLKDGLAPLYIRLISGRKKIDIRISNKIAPTDLLPNGSVKKSCFNYFVINNCIQIALSEVNNIIMFHHLNKITFSKTSFLELYNKKVDTSLLHKYIRTESSQMAICRSRLHSYTSLANHIEKHFGKTTLADCNYTFLVKLEKIFVYELQFKQNTVSSFFSRLRAVLNIAEKKKLLVDNPFIYYKIKGFTSNRQYLNKIEVLLIEDFYNNTKNESLKNVAAIFLFLCYTGLRIGDFTKLKFTDIINGCIEHVQGKTKAQNTIPLCNPVLRFIGENGFNFYKISSVKINKYLKIIAKQTEITKLLSCHVARHTFATLSLEQNISLVTISKILGHSKINTTMIYAKVLDETKKIEIAKWNTFLGEKA